MARIVADRGRQRVQTGEGVGYCFIYEMDCGCEIRVDERTFTLGSRSSGVDLRDRLVRVAGAHDCEVVVHHAPERYRREIRQRRQAEPPVTYMGLDIGSGDSSSWLMNWQREVLGTFRMDPVPRPERSRGQPAPTTAPERAVREAAERLRGAQVSGVIVDEVGPAPTAQTLGGLNPRWDKGAFAEPKKQEDRKFDRFELIELD